MDAEIIQIIVNGVVTIAGLAVVGYLIGKFLD